MDTDTRSPEYLAAIDAHDEAIHLYTEAQRAYRAREIGDEAFLAARAAYGVATHAFDIAFAAEAARG